MEPESLPPRAPKKPWTGRLVKGAIALVAAYFTYHFLTRTSFDWSQLARRVEEASWPYLALGVALLLARFSVWDWRYRLAARRVAGTSSGPVLGFFVFVASSALNLITPAARVIGGFMRARFFARTTGRSFGFFYGVVLYDQTAHMVVMTTCTWITVIAAAFALGRPGLGGAAASVLLAGVLTLLVWSRRRGPYEDNPLVRFLARRAEKAEGRFQRFFSHGHEAVGVFVRLLGYPDLHLKAAALGTLYFLVNAAAQWVLFLALGEPVNPLAVITVVAVGTTAGTLSGTPGGLGTTELTMMVSFRMMGIDEVLAAAGILLYRGLHYISVLAIGLPALAILEMRGGPEELEEGG